MYREVIVTIMSMVFINVCICTGGANRELDEKIYLMLDQQLRPLEPDRTCEEGVRVFEEHKEVRNF